MSVAQSSLSVMDIASIRELVADDLAAADTLIHARLSSDVALINQLSHYIVNNGGKRLRPLITLLCARACGYRGSKHIEIAAIIEFIHTATLIHDDVVDESELRRGQETANQIWGNEASVLVGDFLYSRAFEMMVEVGSMEVMKIMARTTNVIAEGEVMQLLNCNDPDTTEESYLNVIHCKTAKLFEAAARTAAVISDTTRDQCDALARYGMHLGTAFQLVDDILDYSSTAEETGKHIGDDLAEGKPTLPLIHAMRNGTEAQSRLIRNAIENGGREHITGVMAAIESTGALEYTSRTARQEARHAAQALTGLPPSAYREALLSLADFAVSRTY